MRKLALLAFIVFSIASTAQAQSKGGIRIFGGLTYGTDANESGINIGGEYLISDAIAVDLSRSFYFTNSDNRYNVTNINGRYYVPSGADIQWYGLFGLSFNSIKITNTDFKRQETSINLGGGFVYPLSSELGLHLQAKYNAGFEGQVEFQAGLSYELN